MHSLILSSCFVSSLVDKAWVAKKLQCRIVVICGEVYPGARCTQHFDCEGTPQKDVWLWLHNSFDGAGQASPHFTLISKERSGSALITNT